MQPLELISTARRLVEGRSSRRPRQADLKRAISTAYYALFHLMCRTCADSFVGTKTADRSEPAWLQVYRSVDHGQIKDRCQNKSKLSAFPKSVEDFANQFRITQSARHDADYHPFKQFTLSETTELIDAAELAIRDFKDTPMKDRRAFAVWIALKERRG